MGKDTCMDGCLHQIIRCQGWLFSGVLYNSVTLFGVICVGAVSIFDSVVVWLLEWRTEWRPEVARRYESGNL